MLHSNDRHPKWQKLGVSSYIFSVERASAPALPRCGKEASLSPDIGF